MNGLPTEHGPLSGNLDTDNDSTSVVIEDLVSRTKTILSELEAFRDRLKLLRQEGTVEIGHFRSTVQSELGMLQRLSQKPDSASTNHIARSSNLPFLEQVWATAKKSRDVVALQKRVYFDPGVRSLSQGMHHVNLTDGQRRKKGSKEDAAVIDSITEGGRIWTKVSLVTNTRLLFDLAKQGWESGGSDYDDEEVVLPFDKDDDDGDVPLVKTAKELTRASRLFRVRTKHPMVHLILPRIRESETAEIDRIIEACRATGAIVFCGEDLNPVPSLENALQAMARNPILEFSQILNIDCTILLAIVSEFSHAKVEKEAWFHTALQRQVEIEDSENLLPSLLYPAMGGHKLVCTVEAAERMREIVETIGTPSEKARTEILMGDDTSKTQEDLIDEMQQWSAYPVPADWQLPILVIDQNEDDCQSSLPDAAMSISSSLTAINKSVFLYGWAKSITTITSNRTVVKQLEHDLERFEDLQDDVWPKMWLCPTARSLVGKEKRASFKETGGKAEAKEKMLNGHVA